MFLKNNFRHAYAHAGADVQTAKSNRMRDAIMFEEADEVADFGSTGGTSKTGGNSAPRKSGSGFNAKPVIIAVIAFIAIILLVIGIVAIATSISKDIKCEDNSFIAYEDHDGVARVAVNGKFIAEYEGDIELIVADDRSFAYVIETYEDGKQMLYVISTKEQTTITLDPVTKVLGTASLKPGAIWYDNSEDRVYHYTKESGTDSMLTKASINSYVNSDNHNFIISGDGETVVFYKLGDTNNPKDKLMMYKDHEASPIISKSNHFPVAVSDDGSVIYVKTTSSDTGVTTLHVVTVIDGMYSTYPVATGFSSMVAMNIKGDEIVYTTTGEDASVNTFTVKLNLKSITDELTPKKIGKNLVFTPIDPKGEIARFETFEKCFFTVQNELAYELASAAGVTVNYLYYLESYDEPQAERISPTPGQFSPNGKHYFSVNKNGALGYYDLNSKSSMSEFIKIRTSEETIIDFAVTQKGNIYWLSEGNRLMYHNLSKGENTPISNSADAISMHTAANVLYFTTDGTLGVFSTKEGSKAEKADMGSVNATGLPVFANANAKETFAGYYDAESDEWALIYTSNGKSFKAVSNCVSIGGIESVVKVPEYNVPTTDTPDTTDSEATDEAQG